MVLSIEVVLPFVGRNLVLFDYVSDVLLIVIGKGQIIKRGDWFSGCGSGVGLLGVGMAIYLNFVSCVVLEFRGTVISGVSSIYCGPNCC